jgi:hypothetical protein
MTSGYDADGPMTWDEAATLGSIIRSIAADNKVIKDEKIYIFCPAGGSGTYPCFYKDLSE